MARVTCALAVILTLAVCCLARPLTGMHNQTSAAAQAHRHICFRKGDTACQHRLLMRLMACRRQTAPSTAAVYSHRISIRPDHCCASGWQHGPGLTVDYPGSQHWSDQRGGHKPGLCICSGMHISVAKQFMLVALAVACKCLQTVKRWTASSLTSSAASLCTSPMSLRCKAAVLCLMNVCALVAGRKHRCKHSCFSCVHLGSQWS